MGAACKVRAEPQAGVVTIRRMRSRELLALTASHPLADRGKTVVQRARVRLTGPADQAVVRRADSPRVLLEPVGRMAEGGAVAPDHVAAPVPMVLVESIRLSDRN